MGIASVIYTQTQNSILASIILNEQAPNREHMIGLLLRHPNIDIIKTNMEGKSVLDIAFEVPKVLPLFIKNLNVSGKLQVVKRLKEIMGDTPEAQKKMLVSELQSKKELALFHLAIKAFPTMLFKDSLLLSCAAIQNLPQAVVWLLNAGSDVNKVDKDSKIPLNYAQSSEIAEILLKCAATPTKYYPVCYFMKGYSLPINMYLG
jgi:hypothetical protein